MIEKLLKDRGHSSPKDGVKKIVKMAVDFTADSFLELARNAADPEKARFVGATDLHYAIWTYYHGTIQQCETRDFKSIQWHTARKIGQMKVKFDVTMYVDSYCVSEEPGSLKTATVTLDLEYITVDDVVIH